MKKIIALISVVLIFGVLSAAAYDYSDGFYVHVVETKYEPYPAEPGSYFDLWLNVQNKGKEARELTFKLAPEFPFSLDPDEEPERNLGKVLSGQGVLVRYRVRVDPNAVEGNNKLKYMFKSAAYDAWNEAAIDIMVKTHDIVLSVTSVETNPEKLVPGKGGIIDISLKNTADSLIKDVKVKLDLEEIPLAPIAATNEKLIKLIDSNEEVNVRFTVMPEPDAEATLYKVPLELDYSDELGNVYSRDNSISVIVGDMPDLSIGIDDTTIYNANSVGEITVKFVNKGLTDVKLLNVKIKPTEEFEVISSKEVYIGNVDSDDYETADFKVFVKKAKDEVKIPLIIEYMDANNDDYNQIVELTLPLYSSREAKKFGLVKGRNPAGIAVLLIIAGAGVYYYRKRKKKQKKEKK